MKPLPLHDEHGEVVDTWWELDYAAEHVVCFDRHLDLKPLASDHENRLRRSGSRAEIRELNRSLPLRDSPGCYGLDDFWAAGPPLGRVRALTWVTPRWGTDTPARRLELLDAVSLIAADREVLERTIWCDGSLRTHLCGLDLEIRDLDASLPARLPPDARIDVDLDWFVDPVIGLEHEPSELAELVHAAGAGAQVDSLSLSERSGFLPSEYRWIAGAAAAALGRGIDPVERSRREAIPARALAVLASRKPIDPKELASLRAELAPLGACGLIVAGLVALEGCGDGGLARECWSEATAAGSPSSWLAYRLGMHDCAAGDHQGALTWFERAAGRLLDTLEAHASVMTVLCLTRLDRLAEAAGIASALAARYPLRRDVVRLASDLGRRTGMPDAHIEDHLVRLEAITGCPI